MVKQPFREARGGKRKPKFRSAASGDPATGYNSALNGKEGLAPNRTIYNTQKGKYGINDFTYERGTMMR